MRSNNKTILKIVIFIVIILISVTAWIYYNDQKSKAKAAEIQAKKDKISQEKSEEQTRLREKYESVKSVYDNTIPGIICWGDSLTAGAGGNGITYPNIIYNMLKVNITDIFDLSDVVNPDYKSLLYNSSFDLNTPEVINMGVDGETTDTILGRNGAIPFVVSADFTISAEIEEVPISFTSESGDKVAPLLQGNAGMESVIINGVEGTISIKQESSSSKEYKYYFTRNNSGEAVSVSSGTVIETAASTQYLNYLPVIFIGQNGGYDSTEELIEQQKAIINHQTENQDKFIIVGLHTKTSETRADLETAMIKEYGDKYINLREYMSTQGLSDAGIKATEEDIQMMEMGMTPSSLLTDSVHFNATGYELVGKLIYDRMDYIGYFNEVNEAIQTAMEN